MIKQFELKTESDMQHFAELLSKTAFESEFIALFGGLGAGKTTFVRCFASALGMDTAASPTFTIVRNYSSDSLSIAHFDCYRLADSDELFALGFDDYLDTPSIIIMEWSENVIDALPPERLEIAISGSGNDPRFIELRSFGKAYDEILEGIEL